MRVVLIVLTVLVTFVRAASAQQRAQPAPAESDPNVILKAAFAPQIGQREAAKIVMRIDDRKGKPRSRSLRLWLLEEAHARYTLILFEGPQDIRNTGLLTVDYQKHGQIDDQWLYLPSLHRTTRLSSRTRSRSFVGSDFSYADLTVPNPAHYVLKLLEKNSKVGDQDAWLIEMVPSSPAIEEETGYKRSQLYIGKRNLVVLRSKSWMRDGRLKYMEAKDIRPAGRGWKAQRLLARTVKGDELVSETVIAYESIEEKESGVVKDIFTPQRLERGL